MFRINADDNDLHWSFAVDRYPSIVYFPALDKAESIPYPPHLPLTLPNLIQFVRHAAGPTADIGVCSRTCIHTNLRTVSISLSKLQTERSRLVRAIYRLRCELKMMFVVPLTGGRGLDSIELNSFADELLRLISPVTTSSEESDDCINTAKATTFPATEPNYEEPPSLASEDTDAGDSSNNMHLQHSVNSMPKDFSDGARRSCSVERLLRMRDELAVLRRRLHFTDVKQSLLRRLYTHVLLPATMRGSRQLERRHWCTIRHHKLVASLHLRYYRDFVSGWDMGS